jgi:hypothetical protein
VNPVPQEDLDCIERQLGRTPRDVHGIAYRCPCGKPAVVETNPRLADGTPFPTFYYATCPKLTGAISTLETTGMMGEMNARLSTDPEYVKSQARERLHFVLPGERQYIVTEGGTSAPATSPTKVANSLTDGQPWYTHLIASISEAGDK